VYLNVLASSVSSVLEIGSLANDAHPRQAVEARLLHFYSKNNWEELCALVTSICEYRSLHRARKRVLKDAVEMIRSGGAGRFNAATFAVPRLFAELEGLLRDYAIQQNTTNIKQRSPSVSQIVSMLKPAASKIEVPTLRLIRNLHFASLPGLKARPGRSLNRHRYAHGRVLAPTRITDAIRVFLLIDLCVYLIDRTTGVDNEQINRRRLYGETLSTFNRIGHDLEKARRLQLVGPILDAPTSEPPA
jgi:hypothetical protein